MKMVHGENLKTVNKGCLVAKPGNRKVKRLPLEIADKSKCLKWVALSCRKTIR
nr:MAG TPA: hypothetical protein [Caudoviricetes sp.]